MSTLAADFLKNGGIGSGGASKNKPFRELQEWTLDFVRDRLVAPSGASDLRRQAEQCAERYVFDEEAPNVVRGLVKNKSIDDKMIWESLRFPATNFWIEYPTEYFGLLKRIGFMIGQTSLGESVLANTKTVMAIVAQVLDGECAVCGLISLPDVRMQLGGHIHLHWFLDHCAGDGTIDKKRDRDAKQFVYDLVDCLFLINTPRVCELREASFGQRKKKLQGKDGNLPLIEYKRLTMRIGIGAPRYKSGEPGAIGTEEQDHRRLHRVVGHFRTYREGREQPKVSFVPQHWRGDASKGILLHEREVKR